MSTAEKSAVKAVDAKIASGPIDFDKLGGEEIYFDRPIAKFKMLPNNVVVGYLVNLVWLQKPKNAGDIIEDSDDPHVNEWPVYVVALTHECQAVEGDNIVTVKAGREVYLPKTDKLAELEQYLGQNEMYEIAVAGNGVMNRPGARTLQKYRHKVLSTRVRTGRFLVGGPQVAQIGVPAQGSLSAQQVTQAQAALAAMLGMNPVPAPAAVPQGVHPLS